MSETKGLAQAEQLPLLPLRGLLAYPNMMLKIDVGRGKSIAAIEHAMQNDQRIFVVAQRDATIEDPHIEDMYGVGTVVRIKQVIKLPDDTVRLIVEGESRALVLDVHESPELQLGEVACIAPEADASNMEMTAHLRVLKRLFKEYARLNGGVSAELAQAIDAERDPNILPDLIAANAISDIQEKQEILETRDVRKRVMGLQEILQREIQLFALERKIHSRVQENLEQHQKEYYLNEQIRVIREELGDTEEKELDALRARVGETPMNAEALEKTRRELKRLSAMAPGTPEYTVSRNYIECMTELPWGKLGKERCDIARARRILDQDHTGLARVKERILEFLAVRKIKSDLKSPILLLVGPPGVGKTSIAKSVARALDRKFVRMSLGGLRDEAEIRGHRRTYIGAIPGRIVSSIRQAGVMNPVFLLDEIDKMGADSRGDPASALLEALDPEQNQTFTDHYLEAPIDLGNVLFITTANTTESIPQPLLDRMDMIEIEGYTREEKANIALKHLLPRQLERHGITKTQLRVRKSAILDMIDFYTREAGVRELERTIERVCRKSALRIAEGASEAIVCDGHTLESFLGARRYLPENVLKQPTTGTINALAWTPFGGVTLTIEAAAMAGHGNLELTGHLGDVMKESARAAYSYIRANAHKLGIADDFFEKNDLHIHVPEGATPKDGPSAGVAMLCAMVSAMTNRRARQDVAMTGEITLLGGVLPIGGVKEKLLAANRMGIHTVLLPKENRKDLEELPKEILSQMDVHLMERAEQAITLVLCA